MSLTLFCVLCKKESDKYNVVHEIFFDIFMVPLAQQGEPYGGGNYKMKIRKTENQDFLVKSVPFAKTGGSLRGL